jgi:hypothetical protein
MNCVKLCAVLVLLIASSAAIGYSQEIQSTYVNVAIPGQWQSGTQFAGGNSGSDIFYDATSGTVVEISSQAGMQKVGEIAKYFDGPKGSSKDAAGVMSVAAFPLPRAYTERASKDLAKGTKPPRMSELKDGDGNPLWFYASQLFDEYHVRDLGGSSEVSEQYLPVRVTLAEQRAVTGGDALLFEVESDKSATDAVLKRFHMPAAYKDQHVRYGWLQFAPGGIAAGQGVLSVAFAAPANSHLTVEEVLKLVTAAKIKTL